MNILKLDKYPFFFINKKKYSFENYKINNYSKQYIIYEKIFFDNLQHNNIIKIINNNVNFDFLQAIYFKFSKIFLESPIRLLLHIKLVKNHFNIDIINIKKYSYIEQTILYLYLKKEFPKIKIIKKKLNPFKILQYYIFSYIYLCLLSIKYIYKKQIIIPLKNIITFSYPRKYLYENNKNIVIIIPFYNPFKKIKTSPNVINPLNNLKLQNTIKLIKLNYKLFYELIKNKNTYSIILGKYIFSYFQLLYLYIDILQPDLLQSYLETIEFLSANNEFSCAINLLKNKQYKTYHTQHGQIQSPLPYRSNCDEFRAWTDYEKNLMLGYSKDKHYKSGYYPYFKTNNFNEKFYTPKSKKLSLVIFTNIIDEIFGEIPYKNFIDIIIKFIYNYNDIFDITIHIHPHEKKKFYEKIFFNTKIEQNKAEYMLKQTDIILSVYSTIIVQALNYKKPIIVYNSFIDEDDTFIGQISNNRKFNNYNKLNEIITNLLDEYKEKDKINIEYEKNAFYKYFK